ncbi:YD repeat-containing protein [Pseudomonas sp. PvP025]|nr:YD repeat-containing protein [Pseudomonas sp. PvP025]MDQ0401008.1 YD repeat-containing protein [Pseudomonas sp. PvP006]
MERDDLHREVYRTQGTLTSCFGYDAMGRKTWQFASTLPAEKLSGVHNPGVNTSLLVEHAYNPIHRRYQYDPAGELIRTLDKLRGEIKYEYEANGQLHSRDTGRLVDSEEFTYDAAANRLNFNASAVKPTFNPGCCVPDSNIEKSTSTQAGLLPKVHRRPTRTHEDD